MLPDGELTSAICDIAGPNGFSKGLFKITTSALNTDVIPGFFAYIMNNRSIAFGINAAGIKPPNFSPLGDFWWPILFDGGNNLNFERNTVNFYHWVIH
jgi:hypothetical protein